MIHKKQQLFIKPSVAIIIIASMMGLSASTAFAKGQNCGKGSTAGFNIERMAHKLGLNDSQKTQISAVVAVSKAEREVLQSQIKSNRQALKEATKQSPYNEVAVRTLAEQQGKIKADMIVLRSGDRAKMYAILDKTQRVTFSEPRQHRQNKRCGQRPSATNINS